MWWCVWDVHNNREVYLGQTKAIALDKSMNVVGSVVKFAATEKLAREYAEAAAHQQRDPDFKKGKRFYPPDYKQ